MMSSMMKILVAASLAVTTMSIAALPAAAQSNPCPIGQVATTTVVGVEYDATNEAFPFRQVTSTVCSNPPPVPGMPAPFGVQGSGVALNDANIYRSLGNVPRTFGDDPNSASVLATIAKGTNVQLGQRDNRWGNDGCTIYENPNAGWGMCRNFSGTSGLREIPNGGAWIGGYGTVQTPWVAPNPGGASGSCIRPADGAIGQLIGGNCVVW